MRDVIDMASGPDTLITAIAPPGAVAGAQMVDIIFINKVYASLWGEKAGD
jgi:hypothetical protein